jgi:hypothetical protein
LYFVVLHPYVWVAFYVLDVVSSRLIIVLWLDVWWLGVLWFESLLVRLPVVLNLGVILCVWPGWSRSQLCVLFPYG